MTTTFDGLRDIIVRDFELPAERLRRDTPLEEIELDSLAVTELVFSLEDEFHVTAGNVNPSFKNLGDIADYIDQLIAERDAAPKKVQAPARKVAGGARAKATRAPAARAKATAGVRAKGASAAPGSGSKTSGSVAQGKSTRVRKSAKSSGVRNGGKTNGSRHAHGARPR